MADELVLQALLMDVACPWQVHNCRLLQQQLHYDAPLPLLMHYDALAADIQDAHPLTIDVLKRMNEVLSAEHAAEIFGVDAIHVARAWQVKYVGKVVIFCEPLQLALRLHFSNTSKSAQTVYGVDETTAWSQQVRAWRVFGVVDVLTKGGQPLVSSDDTGDELSLMPYAAYQALPSSHSLAVTALINEHRALFDWLDTAIHERLGAVGQMHQLN